MTVVLVALTTAALSLPGTVLTSAPAHASGAGDVTGLLNGARSAAGLAALTPDSGLAGVAQAWAERMAASGSLSHNPSTGAQIPGGWSSWGENVAWSTDPSPSGLHASLMGSSGHRANILSAAFTAVGVGYATDAAGGAYVAEVFAAYPRAAAPAPQAPAQAAPGAAAAARGDAGAGTGAGPASSTGDTAREGARGAPGAAAAVDSRARQGLVLGARGPAVAALQERLRAHGQVLEADGAYGPATAAAVTAFQASRGLEPDGVVGAATTAALALDPPAPPGPSAPPPPSPAEAQQPAQAGDAADTGDAAPAPAASTTDGAAQDARGASASGTTQRPTASPSSPGGEAPPAVPAYGWVVAALAVLAAMSLSVVGARRRSAQIRGAKPPQD
ncbi:CAP domain-containing protein [Oerskovia turbata]